MSESSDLGKKGEELAAEHLRKQGYLIVARNFRFGSIAELDIVATRNKEIVFVEVKTRAKAFMNEAAITVPRQKQKQIMKAASHFLQKNNIPLPWRFDIISIVHNESETKIEHLEDAFLPIM